MDTLFLEDRRKVTSDWHLRQVVKWLNYDNNRQLDNVLVYASLELRCAIERNLFETLLLMKDRLTPKEEHKCRSQKGLFALIKTADPHFRLTFIFSKAYLSVSPYPHPVTILDIGYVMGKWQELSDYCHKLLKPTESFESPNRDFQRKGFKIIREVLDYYYKLQNTQASYIRPDTIKEPLKEVYWDFIKGRIDEAQLKTRLNLMLPVLNARKLLTVTNLKRI